MSSRGTYVAEAGMSRGGADPSLSSSLREDLDRRRAVDRAIVSQNADFTTLSIGDLYENSDDVHTELRRKPGLSARDQKFFDTRAAELRLARSSRAELSFPRLDGERVAELDGRLYQLPRTSLSAIVRRPPSPLALHRRDAESKAFDDDDDDDDEPEDNMEDGDSRTVNAECSGEHEKPVTYLESGELWERDDDDEGNPADPRYPSKITVGTDHAHCVPPLPEKMLRNFEKGSIVRPDVRMDSHRYLGVASRRSEEELLGLPSYALLLDYVCMRWRDGCARHLTLGGVLDEVTKELRMSVANVYMVAGRKDRLLLVVRMDSRHFYCGGLELERRAASSSSSSSEGGSSSSRGRTATTPEVRLGWGGSRVPSSSSAVPPPGPTKRTHTISGIGKTPADRTEPLPKHGGGGGGATRDDETDEADGGTVYWSVANTQCWAARDSKWDDFGLGRTLTAGQRATMTMEWQRGRHIMRAAEEAAASRNTTTTSKPRHSSADAQPPPTPMSLPMEDEYAVSGCVFFSCGCSLASLRDSGVRRTPDSALYI